MRKLPNVCCLLMFLLSALWVSGQQVPLAGGVIPKYVDPLPDLELIVAGDGQIELQMTEFQTKVLPDSFYTALAPPYNEGTYVWGYLKPGQTSRTSYLGPVIVATRGNPASMKFVNNLGHSQTTNVLAYKHSTDQTLHWADPLNGEANMWNHMAMPPMPGTEGAMNYDGPIPACVHLHGGEVPPVLDGGPDAWFTSDGLYRGHGFYTDPLVAVNGNEDVLRYPNTQEGGPLWFHDHTLGVTRLNVYCGLAGGYLLLDPVNDPQNLPEGPIPLIIQDRMFDINGQLFYSAGNAGGILWATNPEHPYWNPEFVGDVICVNGKAWPYKQVQPKRYTFLFLNGSNARTYEMFLADPISGNKGPSFWVIGTDGGYLDTPVRIAGTNNMFAMMPGERYSVIIDFAGFQAGVIGPNGLPYSGTWLLKNTAKTPFPAGAAPLGGTVGQIMQFVVTGQPVADTSFNPAVPGARLRSGSVGNPNPVIVRLANPVMGTVAAGVTVQKTRLLTLNEVMGMPQMAVNPITGVMTAYPGGPLEILVNNTRWNGERPNGVMTDPMSGHSMYTFESRTDFSLDAAGHNWLSELPIEGQTEIWEIVNVTADAHPIHLHLVQFQLINRQAFDTKKYNADYAAAFPGGGYDSMTGLPYPAGVYIPSYGPPLDYSPQLNPLSGGKYGGNPDVGTMLKGKPKYLKGAPTPPLPHEAGWKDTVIMYPGQVTRIIVRFAPTDMPAATPAADAFYPFDPQALGYGYVWHCHIIDHEDNEMMRPYAVTPNDAAVRECVQGVDY